MAGKTTQEKNASIGKNLRLLKLQKLEQGADPSSSDTYYKIGQLMKEQNLRVNSDLGGVNSVIEKNMAFIKVRKY